MKRILITGAGSYVGMSLEKWLSRWPERYAVDTVDMIGDGWKETSFRGYDAVFHVAGIVHREDSKNDPAQAQLYDRVNTRLAVDTARKAREEGVRQFIFMSSASVYGLTAPMGKTVMITKDTPLKPVDNYGISKAKAEEGLLELAGDNFRLAILRPPMIYGKGCRGNYVSMAKLAKKLPVFPWVENQRSMLYIDNLLEFVRLMVENEEQGIFWPQNGEYSNTTELVQMIAKTHGKKILIVPGFTWALKLASRVTGLVNKAFGSSVYDMNLSDYKEKYRTHSLLESIDLTEKT